MRLFQKAFLCISAVRKFTAETQRALSQEMDFAKAYILNLF